MSGEALRELAERIERDETCPPEGVVTWKELLRVVNESAQWVSDLEYERYMGEDL